MRSCIDENFSQVTKTIPPLHLVVTMRLSEGKARDKLLPLLRSHLVRKVTLVRYADVQLESDKLSQVIYDLGVGEKRSRWVGLRNVWVSLWTTLRIARRESPDVFLGFYLFPHGLIAWLAARLTGRRAVVSLIGSDFNVNLKTPLLGRALRFMLRHFDAVVVFGENTSQEIIRYGIPEKRVFILPNTADTEIYAPDNTVSPDVDVICVTDLLPFKRVDLVLRAFKQVYESRPQAKLLIVGDGAVRPALQDLARMLGIDRAVEFYGHSTRVVDQLRRARVFVLLSEREGLPMAVIEAMCTGLPVVVTDVGAIASVVKDGENGYFVPSPADPKQVAERILTLLSDAAHYSRLREAALRVRETHSYERGTQIWEEVLTSLFP